MARFVVTCARSSFWSINLGTICWNISLTPSNGRCFIYRLRFTILSL